jgi:hypothetical protein
MAFFDALPFTGATLTPRQPLSLRRAILHHERGFPALGRSPIARRLLALCERVTGALLPRSRWTYIQIITERATRAGPARRCAPKPSGSRLRRRP